MSDTRIIDATPDTLREHGTCFYKNPKTPGFLEKLEWSSARFDKGLKMKYLLSGKDGNQGMIEYLPGELCWRPVEASGYLFIHCMFIYKKDYKGKGYATELLNECINDARESGKHGVAIVTRKGSFMIGSSLFLKNGFEVVDKAPPDFELCVLKFDENAPDPQFKQSAKDGSTEHNKGLVIIRSDQCPYTVKNVREMCELSEQEFGITPKVIDLKNHEDAQQSPCAFGTFCILYDGKVVAENPTSKTRFGNIMRKILN